MAVFQGSGFVKKIYDGDVSIIVVDSRTPDWVEKGTIPGAMNIPSVTRRTSFWYRGGMQDWENLGLTTI